ncbi:XdhC family protein [Paenibacillus alginolyticus]|uniref:XdhC family protein n=1 Tax=Paenibacillus alginolyticus TaxID=59839 RepID=A0ABT4GIU8_9BACL|nr:XdhC/CoxI family protein [Paenibacillus alginolyticus]MCY9695964.1 XdhC family protein [Paenibacillus alginolyticus]MEC0146818.1 XdhC family protein [Paenibacillus alginolyticus]
MEAYDILQAVESNAQARVLATVIHVEGHAYRKQGAIMLLMANESSLGSISPGCLEADLSAYVPAVWESQKPQMVEYDMRPADDFGWGATIGCGGLIRILLEPVSGELLVNLLAVKASLDRGEAVHLLRTFSDGYSNITYTFCDPDEGAPSDRQVVYASLFTPKPRVIVFGANPDAMPLAQMAASVGFRVVVADWREAFCNVERFPGAETVVAFPEQLVEQLKLNAQDYVIVMSHQFEKDSAFVRGAMESSLRYLGIMGSRDRTEKMLEGLERPDCLHYPVGLKIGSEGPVENAVSIVAELIRMKRGVRTTGEWASSAAMRRDIQSCRLW